ncbi:MAG: hypothetical protein WBG92_11460, partial [Thiohalocapsa sp.]
TDDDGGADDDEPAADAEAQEMAPAAQDWLERNGWFRETEQHQARRQLALTINDELQAEGMDRGHARFYVELDKRLKQKIEQQRGRGRASAAAAVDRGSPQSGGRDGRMGSAEQQAYKQFLRTYNADDSADMRKAFARRNRATVE